MTKNRPTRFHIIREYNMLLRIIIILGIRHITSFFLKKQVAIPNDRKLNEQPFPGRRHTDQDLYFFFRSRRLHIIII